MFLFPHKKDDFIGQLVIQPSKTVVYRETIRIQCDIYNTLLHSWQSETLGFNQPCYDIVSGYVGITCHVMVDLQRGAPVC